MELSAGTQAEEPFAELSAQLSPLGMQCGNTSEVLQIMFNLEESVHNTSQDMEYKNKAFFLVNTFLPLK